MTRRLICFAAALLLTAALAAPASAERRVALVIGNAAYPASPLKNPVNDARDMALALRKVGFEVIERENASLAQMEQAVDLFWQQLKAGGTGLFFFAGHGLQVKGSNYLVPVDADIKAEQDVKLRCLDVDLVLGRMENAGNPLNLVILDACRSNPFARAWRSQTLGLAKMDAPTGTLVAYATAPGSVAADGDGKNGLYTSQLLQHIGEPGLSVERLFKQVRIGVMNATARQQVPWESSSLVGDFSFAPAGGEAADSAPAAAPAASAPAASPARPATQPATQPVAQSAAQPLVVLAPQPAPVRPVATDHTLDITRLRAAVEKEKVYLSFNVVNTSNAPAFVAYTGREGIVFTHMKGDVGRPEVRGLQYIGGEPRKEEGGYTRIEPGGSVAVQAAFTAYGFFGGEGDFSIVLVQLIGGKVVRFSKSVGMMISGSGSQPLPASAPSRLVRAQRGGAVSHTLEMARVRAAEEKEKVNVSFDVVNTSDAPAFVAYTGREGFTFTHMKGDVGRPEVRGIQYFGGEPRVEESGYTRIEPGGFITVQARFTTYGFHGGEGDFSAVLVQLVGDKIVRFSKSFSLNVPGSQNQAQGGAGRDFAVVAARPSQLKAGAKSAASGGIDVSRIRAAQEKEKVSISFDVVNNSDAPAFVAYTGREGFTFTHMKGDVGRPEVRGIQYFGGEPRTDENGYTRIEPGGHISVQARFTAYGFRGGEGDFNVVLVQLAGGKITRFSKGFSLNIP